MFQFSRFAQYSYVFTVMWPTDVGRVSPFGNPRIKVSLHTPRGLSHVTTSFIASHCLGIHRMRLFTWPYNPNKSVFMNRNSSSLIVLCGVSFPKRYFFCYWELILMYDAILFYLIKLNLTSQHAFTWTRFAILLPLRLQDYIVTDFQIVKERINAFYRTNSIRSHVIT